MCAVIALRCSCQPAACMFFTLALATEAAPNEHAKALTKVVGAFNGQVLPIIKLCPLTLFLLAKQMQLNAHSYVFSAWESAAHYAQFGTWPNAPHDG